ncbi:hypothetical protein [uncultured Draconibacterium sp.]|uniref:hypothetical protein n=1 Tax=uncultured Draconibacterium sp. TaxID=1573823 RepID=UPI0029C6E19C|nr:hypothetical protein [uncultured Draconibacterium sp.]
MRNTLFVVLGLLILLVAACDKVDKRTITSEEASVLVVEAATAYSIYASTQEEGTTMGFQLDSLLKSATNTSEDYPLIFIEPLDLTTWPKIITVDYGPENISGFDNHELRGKLVISADNFPSVSGAEWEITFDEFYHDNYKVEGVQTISFDGLNGNEHPVYTCSVSDGVITSPDGKKFYFEQQTQREWVNGYDTNAITSGETVDFCDDEFEITGTHSGISSDGYAYSMSTTTPLVVGTCCRWVKEGVLYIGLDDYDLSCEIDYRPASDTGDTCNNVASITVFGETFDIALP